MSPESASPRSPVGEWSRCPACGMLVYDKRLKRALRVCPDCGHHFVLSARERLALLLDEGSFDEYDADLSPGDPIGFVDTKAYPVRLAESSLRTGERDAAIWGTGTLAGTPITLCALDFTFMGGSMGCVVGEKVTRAMEHAASTATPIVVCSASGGARMQEGPLALMQMAKTAAARARLADAGVPYISLLTDPTYGGVSASFAMLGDLIIAEPRARAGFAGRSVIEQTIHQKLPAKFQTAEFLLEKGHVDMVVPRAELRDVLARILAYHAHPVHATDRRPASSEPVATRRPQRPSPGSRSATAWDIVGIARHQLRPRLQDLIRLMFTEFIELHGDRAGHDDRAIIGGLASIEGWRVMIIGHQRGATTQDNVRFNFGMPNPEGYRKARRLIEYAGHFGLPILTFIDTPGAYPGQEAEERNQSEGIARAMESMARVPVPVICAVIGEGGSGGALAIGVGNRVLMLENATYSVISPEGCATILFKDASRAPRAAEASRLTASELLRLGIVDDIVAEPSGGAHTDHAATAAALKEALVHHLGSLARLAGPTLVDQRYARFRAFGECLDRAGSAADEAAA